MKTWLITAIIIVIAALSGLWIYYSTNQVSTCAQVGENIYDMESKGPVECCPGLYLEPCEGECTPSIPGKCVSGFCKISLAEAGGCAQEGNCSDYAVRPSTQEECEAAGGVWVLIK